jgi:hypothetical protein
MHRQVDPPRTRAQHARDRPPGLEPLAGRGVQRDQRPVRRRDQRCRAADRTGLRREPLAGGLQPRARGGHGGLGLLQLRLADDAIARQLARAAGLRLAQPGLLLGLRHLRRDIRALHAQRRALGGPQRRADPRDLVAARDPVADRALDPDHAARDRRRDHQLVPGAGHHLAIADPHLRQVGLGRRRDHQVERGAAALVQHDRSPLHARRRTPLVVVSVSIATPHAHRRGGDQGRDPLGHGPNLRHAS